MFAGSPPREKVTGTGAPSPPAGMMRCAGVPSGATTRARSLWSQVNSSPPRPTLITRTGSPPGATKRTATGAPPAPTAGARATGAPSGPTAVPTVSVGVPAGTPSAPIDCTGATWPLGPTKYALVLRPLLSSAPSFTSVPSGPTATAATLDVMALGCPALVTEAMPTGAPSRVVNCAATSSPAALVAVSTAGCPSGPTTLTSTLSALPTGDPSASSARTFPAVPSSPTNWAAAGSPAALVTARYTGWLSGPNAPTGTCGW
mmetsp:Transcript_60855/g.193074  ORF Transcript_60855/g.193074 Transcript_60855/m.193074 type:complete len:260 (+) Transcript_60855:701-1480(+)